MNYPAQVTRRTKKWLLIGGGVVFVILLSLFLFFVAVIAPLGTRYVAKRVCSGVFLSGRPAADVWQQELSDGNFGYPGSFGYEVDRERASVRATWFGLAETEVRFLPDLGCTASGGELASDAKVSKTSYQNPFPFPRPVGTSAKLTEIVEEAFVDPKVGTRAVLIVHKGQLIAEKYAPGWNRNMPQLGWSMTKSIAQVLIGLEVHAGRLSPERTDLFEEWSGDKRAKISLLDLLQMSSGLEWEESYTNPFGDAIEMLFDSHDMAGVALHKELEADPGTLWKYSSGTSNLLTLLLRRLHETNGEDYLSFPQRRLFAPLGMKSAVLEPDPSGNFAGSSYAYATPLDWARFGQALMQDGVVDGVRLLPEGWRDLSCRPAPKSGGVYGAHFWLRVGPNKDSPAIPSLPKDICHAAGHEGQYVSMSPANDLVIVRMGLTRPGRLWDQEAFVARVVGALP